MKNLYRQIQQHLVGLSGTTPQGNDLKRLNLLSGLICGMIRKGNSSLPDIGSGIPKDIDANSKTRSAERFVKNKWTDYDLHFLPFLAAFLRGLLCIMQLHQGIHLVIDGSQVGKDNAMLMVSLVWGNRGIPICWIVKKGSKGHFSVENHLEVLKLAITILQNLLPKNVQVTLLGDGEFDAIELQELCREQGWDYVLRTACNSIFYENGELFHARDVQPDDTQHIAFVSDVEFTEKRYQFVNFTCWFNRKKHEEPIFLVSNLENAGDIIEFYTLRFSIECLFKDLKSTSFNVHKTRLKKPEDVFNLIIIAALAFILVTTFSIIFDSTKNRKKVQRVRKDRKVLSFFTFGFKLLNKFVDLDVPFKFSFHFSKNFDDFFRNST